MRSPIHVEIPSFYLPKLIYREGSGKDFHFDIGEVTNLNWQTFGETPQKVCWGGGGRGGAGGRGRQVETLWWTSIPS